MTIRLLAPTLGPTSAAKTLAPRPTNLDGAVLGLLDNGKTHGRAILARVADNLAQRHRIAGRIEVRKATYSFPAAPEEVARLEEGATAIIAAIGD
ncbi:MAG: hypothetical protein R2733_10360 [Acidimicrobiales bacterium]